MSGTFTTNRFTTAEIESMLTQLYLLLQGKNTIYATKEELAQEAASREAGDQQK